MLLRVPVRRCGWGKRDGVHAETAEARGDAEFEVKYTVTVIVFSTLSKFPFENSISNLVPLRFQSDSQGIENEDRIVRH